jgi:hypothetical protein
METMNMIGMNVAKIESGRYECARQTVSGTKDGTYSGGNNERLKYRRRKVSNRKKRCKKKGIDGNVRK